jgi:hypothetical protein
MEMNVGPYLNTLATATPQGKDLKPFIELIFKTCNEIRKRFNAPAYVVDQEAAEILYLSFLASQPDGWINRFNDARNKAAKFWINPRTYWKTLAMASYTPAIENECREFIPSFDPENYLIKTSAPPAPQRITPERIAKPKRKSRHKRGELWKLDRRWDHLWNSSRAVFLELLRRTQYPKRPENFPWCQAGVKSLKKFTGVSVIQVRRALIQLECFKLIKRIVRGYKDQGASKYLVFIVPAMSGAFSRKSLHAKKNPRPKKRIPRIS